MRMGRSRPPRAPAPPRGHSAPAGTRPSLPRPAGRRRPGADAVTGPNRTRTRGRGRAGTARQGPPRGAHPSQPPRQASRRLQGWLGDAAEGRRTPRPGSGTRLRPRGRGARRARPDRLWLDRLRLRPLRADVAQAGPAWAVAARRVSLRALDLTVTSGGPQTGSPPAGALAVRLPGRPPASRRPIPGPGTRRPRAGGPTAGLLCGRRRGTMIGTRTRSRQEPAGVPGHPGRPRRPGRRGPGAGPAGAAAAGRS